ncbi:MAG: hypothetical protein HC902_10755 [Calothrix sp. SM1_5_4]|nr:hypothetical protein [Calothrix sp. SM1_5_4]
MSILESVNSRRRPMDKCAIQRLENLCREQRVRLPAAKEFVFRSWAVASGRSGFEFTALDKMPRGRQDTNNASLMISGPLIFSNQRPMWPNKLSVSPRTRFGGHIRTAHLIANDGGGNLNLQLVFRGQPRSHLRLNITALLVDTRPEFGADVPAARARLPRDSQESFIK